MSAKENVMPLSEKRENQKGLLDTNNIVNSKEASKHSQATLFTKAGLKETQVNHAKLQVEEEKSANVLVCKKEDILVYIPENPRRSPSPHSIEILSEYPESKINIHHRREPNFLQFEPTITSPKTSTNRSKTTDLEQELKQAIRHKEELAIKVQSARKELGSKKQQALEIDQKIQQMTKYKASIESNKQEMIENQAMYQELISLLETADAKGLQFDQALARYDDEINALLNDLSVTKYRITEFKESHSRYQVV